MRRVPIRMKLAGALAVPLIVLLGVTALAILSISADVDNKVSQTRLAKAASGPAGLVTKLQDERSYAVVELIGTEGSITVPNPSYDGTRHETDEAIAAFRDEIRGKSAEVIDAFSEPLASLETLTAIRADIDDYEGRRSLTDADVEFSDEIYTRYSDVISPFFEATTALSLAIDDPELRHGTALVDTTSRQIEVLADLARTTIVGMTLGGGITEPREVIKSAQLKAKFDRNNNEILSAAPPYDTVIDRHYPHGLVDDFSDRANEVITTGSTELTPYLAVLDVPEEDGYIGFRGEVADAVNTRADEISRSATATERRYLTFALVTLVSVFSLAWIVSRSITRPLRSLTLQATEMANERLPAAVSGILATPLGHDVSVPDVDPVVVHTSDEVSDVAAALNTVQDTALDLAIEQAVLRRNIADSFVNLGRRNQNLLARQLDFITGLESHETDPDTLANLFRLDHLATRMRRNAESLLVLADVAPSRRWAAPVRLSDVIRAALSEVEDYQRIAIRSVEPGSVSGTAAADLAHLIAELVENALVFSPADSTVDIRGRSRPDGYTLAVIDTGSGMTPGELDVANRRLAGAESFTVAPSKYLGHYVAGNLAARLGAWVHLSNTPGKGVTAAIHLPHELMAPDSGDQVLPSADPAPPTPWPAPGSTAPVSASLVVEQPATVSEDALRAVSGSPATEAPPPGTPWPSGSWPMVARDASGDAAARPPAIARPPAAGAPPGSVPAAQDQSDRRDLARPLDPDLVDALSRYTVGSRRPELAPPHPGSEAAAEPVGDLGAEPLARSELPAWGPAATSGHAATDKPLARRVRGAHAPTARVVRRGDALRPRAPASGPRHGAGPADPGGLARTSTDGDGQGVRSAEDVYSFLTTFTAGVQQGLDEVSGRLPEP